jgi:uncharacterized protein YprB with RNaseH-like and TPR domain
MSDLTERLKALGVRVGPDHLKSAGPKFKPKIDLADAIDGSWEKTPQGNAFVLHRYYGIGDKFGSYPLQPAANLSWYDKSDPDLSLSTTKPSQIGYIDTETSGLSGGAGIYTFLIGVGRFEQDQFHLAQFFLQDPGNELAQLAALEEFLAPLKILVSYNGKSFDFPRLKTRYRLHGWPDPLTELGHLDLLHLVRKIWRGFLSSCTLGEVEHSLLGIERTADDIPGWQVSDVFLQYLSDRNPAPLKKIFYHNEIDIVSLAALIAYISSRINKNLKFENPDQSDLIHLASYISTNLSFQKGKDLLELALKSETHSTADQHNARHIIASYYKSKNQFRRALPYWEKSAEDGNISAQIELAKAYEHQFKSYPEAIHWTLAAIDQHQKNQPNSKQLAALKARLSRLKKKVITRQQKDAKS